MKEYLYIPLSFLCLLLFSCAAGVRHYYPPSISNLSRSELVELNNDDNPFIRIEAIDGRAIGPYMRPLYIEPGPHQIVVRYRKAKYVSEPVAITIDGFAGEIYELEYSVKFSGKERRTRVVTAGAELAGLSEPPPHPLVMRSSGLVYLYREYKVFGAGTNDALPVYLNGQPLQNLYNGSFCPVILRPGKAVFSLPDVDKRVVIDVEPETVYYLKGAITMGGGLLKPVDEESGGREIRETWFNALCNEVPRGYYPFVPRGR